MSRFDAAVQAKCEDIRLVRDFVSHVECDRTKVVAFISTNLPSAVVSGRRRPTVRFDRLYPEHRAFVARYEVESGRIARTLAPRTLAQFAINDLPIVS